MSGALETEVHGDPASLAETARWLRRGVAADLIDAADRQAHARRRAAVGWEGAGAEAYYDAAGAALVATDDHADRVRRAAGALDEVAARLRGLERTMADVRDRAEVGGLVVAGTTVLPPVRVSLGPVEPGRGVGPTAAQTALFARLVRDVADARAGFATWAEDRVARARDDAAERGSLDRQLAALEGGPVAAATVPGGDPGAGTSGPSGARLAGATAPTAGPTTAPGGTGGTGGGVAAGAPGGPAAHAAGVPGARPSYAAVDPPRAYEPWPSRGRTRPVISAVAVATPWADDAQHPDEDCPAVRGTA